MEVAKPRWIWGSWRWPHMDGGASTASLHSRARAKGVSRAGSEGRVSLLQRQHSHGCGDGLGGMVLSPHQEPKPEPKA